MRIIIVGKVIHKFHTSRPLETYSISRAVLKFGQTTQALSFTMFNFVQVIGKIAQKRVRTDRSGKGSIYNMLGGAGRCT